MLSEGDKLILKLVIERTAVTLLNNKLCDRIAHIKFMEKHNALDRVQPDLIDRSILK